MQDSIILYHGTIHDFEEIDVTQGKPYKDFGRGFYTTKSYEHAINLAERNSRIEAKRIKELGLDISLNKFVYSYTFERSALNDVKVKTFETPDKAWVEFVVQNRTEDNVAHGFDLIIGAVANDDTRITIQNYLFGTYGEPGSSDAVADFLKHIKIEKLPTQWMFATSEATDLLHFIGKEKL